ncbi:hypothetical protein [Collimonas humicola]|uniref:hypothetical protein n=1 Tax=Collimonas humicola TaxID=2825886 RepID=UPI001B8D9C6E|nr:hypothetical protein [Collimonas humicola]
MSTETSFLNIDHITIGQVQTTLCYQAPGSQFTTRRLDIHFKDGSRHGLTFFSQGDQIAAALEKLVADAKVSA